MEFENLLTLIKAVSDSSLSGFKYEENGVKISMSAGQIQVTGVEQVVPVSVASAVGAAISTSPVSVEAPSGQIVKSPLVGTFYTSPSEDADTFASVGDTVKAGQTLAIIEAMKLMNDIESDFDGTVAEIYVQNGEVVEYGQPLFRIS